MIDYCHYIKGTKRNEWHFIPACMGGAAQGPEHCTCLDTNERLQRLEKQILPRIAELSQTVAALENFVEEQFRKDGAEPIIVEFDVAAAEKRELERRLQRSVSDSQLDRFRRKQERQRRDDENPQ